MRKSGITTWGLFDDFFEELIPDFEWGGNEGLESFWGAYYRYPDAESIQRIMETRMDKKVVRKESPPSLGGASLGLSPKSPILQTSDDASATATTFTSTIISSSPGTATSISDQVSNKQTSDLQLALIKHWDDILHLLWAGTDSGKHTIPPKMLQKIRVANMKIMNKTNSSIGRAGGKLYSTRKLKEMGNNSEIKAKEIHNAKVARLNVMDHEPPPPNNSGHIEPMITDPKDSVPNQQQTNDFWQTILPNECQILNMELDGNCLFHSISDQLNHDNGAQHEFTRHQITNHINRNGEDFKHFLLLCDDHEDISNLDNYIHKMGQNGAWGGHPEVYAAAWCYGVDITIYSWEYAKTGGFLVLKGDGPNDKSNSIRPMWFLLYHGNNHFNSIWSPRNPSRPIQHIANVEQYLSDLEHAMEDHHDDILKIALSASKYDTLNPPHKITRIWDTSCTIMSYISGQLLDAGGESISEDQLETLQTQAEDHAIKHIRISSAHPLPDTAPIPVPSASSLAQSSILQYEGELHAVIKNTVIASFNY